MKILIVCATHAECSFLITGDQGKLLFKPGKPVLHQYNGLDLTFLNTGVGMVATTYFLCRELAANKYDLAINAGLAGCFHKNILLGTVFNIVTDRFAEMGAEDDENFISIFQMGLQDPDEFPFSNGELLNRNKLKSSFLQQLPKAAAITVNKVHGSQASVEKIMNLYHPDVETMEGAAFFYVCLIGKIPFLQIRTVSNLVEKRNRAAWNIPLAMENLKTAMEKLLDDLSG